VGGGERLWISDMHSRGKFSQGEVTFASAGAKGQRGSGKRMRNGLWEGGYSKGLPTMGIGWEKRWAKLNQGGVRWYI